MYIVVLSFVLSFVGCGANMNSFNINVEGTVDYQNNINNNNTNSNTGSNNTNSGTNNNTNSGTNNNTTNSGTSNNTNSNTNNNANTNITDNIGTQLSTRTALEVGAGTGIPTTGGENLTIQVYTDYLILPYTKTLTKVRYSQDIASIVTEGLVSGSTARVPASSTFIKIYFDEGGDSVSKIFEIQAASATMPTS